MKQIAGHFQPGFATDTELLRKQIHGMIGTFKVIIPDNGRLGGETPMNHKAIPVGAHACGPGRNVISLESDQADALVAAYGAVRMTRFWGEWVWLEVPIKPAD